MRTRAAGLAVLALLPALAGLPGLQGDAEAQPVVEIGERVFVLTMHGNEFNGRNWPDTPLLEAYEGERMHVVVHVPLYAAMHTFHLHGHPWEDPDTGRFIDAVRLDGGETHRFTATAGLEAGHDGDWFYHCHVGTHFVQGMWGLLRVYPYTMAVEGELDALTVTLMHEGAPLEGATLEATLRDNVPDTPRAADATSGEPVDLAVQELGDGRYRVVPDLERGAAGELVLVAQHPTEGESLARLDLPGDGTYTLDRHVVPEPGTGVPTPALEPFADLVPAGANPAGVASGAATSG